MKVDPDPDHFGADIEAKPVFARDRLKRRDVKDLVRGDRVVPGDRAQILVGAQIGMAIAKSVADLGHNGTQRTLPIMAEPEGHRVEHMPKNTRLRQKRDFETRNRNSFFGQDLVQPDHAAPLAGGSAVVLVVQRHKPSTVAREKARRALRRLGIEQHVVHTIGKAVRNSSPPAVHRAPAQMLHRLCHAATLSRAFMPATTSTALAKPSS